MLKLRNLFIELTDRLDRIMRWFGKHPKPWLALATFIGWSALFTWKMSILLMVAIGYHESCHVFAMKRLGMKTKGFFFLPFLGGISITTDRYKTYFQNVIVALAGPLGGMFLALLTTLLYFATGSPILAGAALLQAMVNLFNLIPVSALDGAQVMRAIAFSINKWVGVAFLSLSFIATVLIMIKLKAAVFILLVAFGSIDLFMEWKYRLIKPGTPKWLIPDYLQHRYYPDVMNAKEIALTIGGYLSTALALLGIFILTRHAGTEALRDWFLR
jgi:Zn-dependent protease